MVNFIRKNFRNLFTPILVLIVLMMNNLSTMTQRKIWDSLSSTGYAMELDAMMMSGVFDQGLFPTDLHVAVYNGNGSAIRILLNNQYIDPNARNSRGETPLMVALKENNYGLIRLLALSPRMDIDIVDRDGNTLLHLAVKANDESFVKTLLGRESIDIDSLNHLRETALLIAVRANNESMVNLLVEKGADMSITDSQDCMPIDIARSLDFDKIVEILSNASDRD